MYGATVWRFWSVMHFGCTSDTIKWRKSLRIGASGPGASGSAKMTVYLVVEGSYSSSLVMEKFGSDAVSAGIVSAEFLIRLVLRGASRLTKGVESVAKVDGFAIEVGIQLKSWLKLRNKVWNEFGRRERLLRPSEA